MLCACSGEQFKFEEAPQSPESLAVGDFSICGLSSRTGDWESKFDDSQVDDVESTLKETASLNYEEARALLGRLEFQRGNLDAALQVFRGIDVVGLKLKMVKAILERSTPTRSRSKMVTSQGAVMSMHSVSLLLEAILLKSKALYGLGHFREAAEECGIILEIAESALPEGMTAGDEKVTRLQELLHQAILLLPEMWKNASVDIQAVDSYRRILSKPWNLPSEKLATLQMNLAALLLHGGGELTNLEEALRLLSLLSKKMTAMEIPFDQEVVDQLSFALTMCGKPENLAKILEQAPPGIYTRQERWYLLSLCYSAAGEDSVALNLLRKAVGPSERQQCRHLPSLLLAAQICCRRRNLSEKGIFFASKAVQCAAGESGGVASRLLALSYAGAARASSSDFERTRFYEESQRALLDSLSIDRDDPETVLTLAIESAGRRDRAAALAAATRYVDLVKGSSVRGWEILVHVAASEGNWKNAEDVVDFALEETVPFDQLVLLRMKAALLNLQGNPRQAIEVYRRLLTVIQSKSQTLLDYPYSKVVDTVEGLETDTWLDLATIYRELGSWSDSEICLEKARAQSSFSARWWDERGKLHRAKGHLVEALSAYAMSSSIDPDKAGPSMATVLFGLGPRAQPVARSLLMNALRVDPTCHVAWLGLGHIYKKEGLLTQAADCFQAALELFASSPLEGFR